jgi:putative redox protein
VTVHVRHDKLHVEDCADCESAASRVDEFRREIYLEGDLNDGQRQRLLEIADKCPVHRTLQSKVRIRTVLR